MTPHHPAAAFGTALLAALILWRVFVRFKRSVGPQRLGPWRAPIVLAIHALLLLALAGALRGHPGLAALFAVSALAGAALGQVAFSRTSFEATPQGLFYVPYSPIALSLAALFAVRVAWRVVELASGDAGAAGAQGFLHSPLTLAMFGLLIGHSLFYTLRLAVVRREMLGSRQRRESGMDAGA